MVEMYCTSWQTYTLAGSPGGGCAAALEAALARSRFGADPKALP
jgi:hypothetical protein